MKPMIKLIVFSALAGLALGVAIAYIEVRPWAVITLSPTSEADSNSWHEWSGSCQGRGT